MDDNRLPQPRRRRVIGLAQKREETISVLTECCSRDLMALEEYERRVELAHAADILDDLGRLTAEVPPDVIRTAQTASGAPPLSGEPFVLAFSHGVRTVDDKRLAVRDLRLKAEGGVLKMIYTSLSDLPKQMSVQADISGSVVKIIVPPEVEVSEELEGSGSIIKCRRPRRFLRRPATVRLRITGTAVRSVVKIITRRKRFF